MQQLEIIDTPVLTVYNKADLMKEEDFVPTLFPNVWTHHNFVKSQLYHAYIYKFRLLDYLPIQPYKARIVPLTVA